jgi:hypothetical protein
VNVLPSSPVELCRAWIEPGLPSVNLDETLTMNARLQSAILANVPDVAGVVARTGPTNSARTRWVRTKPTLS